MSDHLISKTYGLIVNIRRIIGPVENPYNKCVYTVTSKWKREMIQTLPSLHLITKYKRSLSKAFFHVMCLLKSKIYNNIAQCVIIRFLNPKILKLTSGLKILHRWDSCSDQLEKDGNHNLSSFTIIWQTLGSFFIFRQIYIFFFLKQNTYPRLWLRISSMIVMTLERGHEVT